MIRYILSIFITIFLVGCSGLAIPSTPSTTNNTVPQWVLNPNNSNDLFFYSVGEGANISEAKNDALKQVSAQISVTISSSTTSTKTATTTTYKRNIENITKSSTEKLNFTGVSIVDKAFHSGTFYSYIKVDKDILFQSQKKEMLQEYNKVKSIWNKITTNGIFYTFKESNNLNTTIDKIMAQLPILKSINQTFDDEKYISELLQIKKDLNLLKSKAIVYFKTNNAFNEKSVFEKAISDFGIKITNNLSNVRNKTNLIIISLNKSSNKYPNRYKSQKMKDVSFADITLEVTTFDSTGKIELAKNIINLRNASRDGYKAAVVKTKKLEREIAQKGILNILLETI